MVWEKHKGKICILGGLLLLLVISFVLYHAGYSVFNFLPDCPFYKWSHWYCPGCGGRRATYALFRGDFAQILRNNPFIHPYLLLLTAFLSIPKLRKSRVLLILISVLPFLFWIVRNLPGYPEPIAP